MVTVVERGGCSQARWRPTGERLGDATRDDTIQLIKDEIPRLRRFARHLCNNPDLADDLVQESLFRAIRKLGSFEPGTNLRAWLFAILTNVYRTELRRLRRYHLDIGSEALQRQVDHTEDNEVVIDLAALRDALKRLTVVHRQMLLLVGVEELTYEEAAAVMGVPLGTVRSRVSRARALLRKVLEEKPRRTHNSD